MYVSALSARPPLSRLTLLGVPQPIIWGAAGTNGQHSFYQLLHQGTKLIPTDFLAPATSHNLLHGSLHHRILLSNYFAQPEALAFGKTEEQVRQVRLPFCSLSHSLLGGFRVFFSPSGGADEW